jgi:pimeloyl-ACP methyl ester carboxylesterase
MKTLRRPDGRQLAFEVGGDPRGYPVIGLHGTPGCRLSRWPADSVYADCGVLYVTTDRAGYGQSTRRPGRTVADEAHDVQAVADAMGFEQFGVIGGSGGGPHALACAASLAGRVERVACLAGLAPLGDRGLARDTWLSGMHRDSAEGSGVGRGG